MKDRLLTSTPVTCLFSKTDIKMKAVNFKPDDVPACRKIKEQCSAKTNQFVNITCLCTS